MDRLDGAFQRIKREDFIPEDVRGEAVFDVPVRIGHGQTNSQPTVVRLMLEWLDPQPGDKVLDVGSGSGWTTALLSRLISPRGKVYAVEKVPELVEYAHDNCLRLGITDAEFFQAVSELGLPEHAPYDRILVSAAAEELPDDLVAQLKPDGKLVVPVRSAILEITKLQAEELEIIPHEGFVFVPLAR